ncbi:MAG: aldo/keto reductase, partial [Alphaproteobacteria bacterium]
VRQGKALYVGISSYKSAAASEAAAILRSLGTPAVIHQPSYSMINRWTEEDDLLATLDKEGVGCIAFSPLAQGLLSDRYLDGVPADSRALRSEFWRESFLSEANLAAVKSLNEIAAARGQKLAQMAIAWVLRDSRMTSTVFGASRVAHVEDAAAAVTNTRFSDEELAAIDALTAKIKL